MDAKLPCACTPYRDDANGRTRWCGPCIRDVVEYSRDFGCKAARLRFGVSVRTLTRWRNSRPRLR